MAFYLALLLGIELFLDPKKRPFSHFCTFRCFALSANTGKAPTQAAGRSQSEQKCINSVNSRLLPRGFFWLFLKSEENGRKVQNVIKTSSGK